MKTTHLTLVATSLLMARLVALLFAPFNPASAQTLTPFALAAARGTLLRLALATRSSLAYASGLVLTPGP
jgi:hypothetical protein